MVEEVVMVEEDMESINSFLAWLSSASLTVSSCSAVGISRDIIEERRFRRETLAY